MAADRGCDIRKNQKIMLVTLLEWSWTDLNRVALGRLGPLPAAEAQLR